MINREINSPLDYSNLSFPFLFSLSHLSLPLYPFLSLSHSLSLSISLSSILRLQFAFNTRAHFNMRFHCMAFTNRLPNEEEILREEIQFNKKKNYLNSLSIFKQLKLRFY